MNKVKISRILGVFTIILIVVLLLLAVIPLLIPIPPLKETFPPQQLADPDDRFWDWDGIQVRYRLKGQGHKNLILLHGFASSIFTWREVFDPLSQQAVVLAYDRPGFGLTERPLHWTEKNPYSADAQVDLLLAILDEFSMDQAVLVGNSAGGSIAVLAALRHPERVQALILVDPAIYLGNNGGFLPAWIRPFLKTPQMRRLGPLLVRSIQNWGDDFALSAWHDPSKINEAIWQGYRLPLHAQNWDRGLWEFNIASHPLHLDENLSQIRVPTLVITGDDDRIIPTADSLRVAQAIPGAQIAVIPKSGHISQEEQPAAFLHVVNEFLDGLPFFTQEER